MADGNLALDRSADTHGQDDGSSLRSSLMAAYDAAPASEDTTIAETVKEPAEDAATHAEGSDEGASEPEQKGKEPDAADAKEGADPDKIQDEVEAPATWAAPDQEMFRKQTPEAREFLSRRMKEMEAGFTKKAQEIAPWREPMQRWQPYLQQLGASPAEAIEALMRTEYSLRQGTPEQKRAAYVAIGKQYGIDLPAQAAQPDQQQDAPPLDPRVQHLAQQVQQLTGTLTQTQQREAMRLRAEQEATQAKTNSEVEAFRETKTEAGQPAHPYFDEVRQDMAHMVSAIMEAGHAVPPLQELYDRCVWANPATRAKVVADQRKAEERERDRLRKQKAREAERAASSIAATPSGGEGAAPMGVRETLERLLPG